MAVLTAPTLTEVATEALKRGGRRNPTAGEITDASDEHLKSVMTKIARRIKTHPLLKTTTYDSTVVGQRTYALPSDYRALSEVTLLDGPDEFRGTAQSGATTTITLAAAFTADATYMAGNKIIITGGTEVDTLREIVSYSDSTKVATVQTAWSAGPDSTSTYLVVTEEFPLFSEDKRIEIQKDLYPMVVQKPWGAGIVGRNLLLNYAPDKIYGLEIEYYVNLMSLDITGTTFVAILKEWYDIFLQGIAVEVMQRFDDERKITEGMIFKQMIDELEDEQLQIRQVEYTN